MHPEILRELNSQRGREMRARAEQVTLARSVVRARRGCRHGGATQAETFAIPAIPDYVDGTFAGSKAEVGIPTARTAA